ncbi:hypothetical protein AAVH_30704 [Aphelenchoides avenae]|nr:hypothetical protein AAVH_30704 [Aphelenchus avenae]
MGVDDAIASWIVRVYPYYVTCVFAFQLATFILLLHIIGTLRTLRLGRYRACLVNNILTVFLFELSIFLCQPTAFLEKRKSTAGVEDDESSLPRGFYIVSSGSIGLLGSKAYYFNIFVISFLLFAHITAVGFCIAYQYGLSTQSGATKYIFDSCLRFFAVYLVFIVVLGGIAFVIMTLLSWDLQPKIPTDTDDGQKDLLLRQLRGSKNLLFVGFEGSKRILIPIFLAYIAIVGPLICYLTYVAYKTYRFVFGTTGYRSKKTATMQSALFKSIIAQVICIFLFYVVPTAAIIAVLFLENIGLKSTIWTTGVWVIVSYAPFSYVTLFLFIGQLRKELLRRAKSLLRRILFCAQNVCYERHQSETTVYDGSVSLVTVQ